MKSVFVMKPFLVTFIVFLSTLTAFTQQQPTKTADEVFKLFAEGFLERDLKKVKEQSIYTGIGFTLGYIVYFQFLNPTSKSYLFGISPEGIGFVGMFINFIVAFTVSSFTKEPPQEVQEMVEEIRIPSNAGEATH